MEKDPLQPNGPPQTSLVEIGPRFVLTPIRIFEGAFGGATVFSNPGKFHADPIKWSSHPASRYSQNLYHLRRFAQRSRERKAISIASGRRLRWTGAEDGKDVEEKRMSWLWVKCSREFIPRSVSLLLKSFRGPHHASHLSEVMRSTNIRHSFGPICGPVIVYIVDSMRRRILH